MKQLLPVLRFLLELATVAGAAVAGASVSWIVALLFPVAVVVIWATLVAPKSARRLADPSRLVLEIVLFGGVGATLIAADSPIFGVTLASAAIAAAAAIRLLPAADR